MEDCLNRMNLIAPEKSSGKKYFKFLIFKKVQILTLVGEDTYSYLSKSVHSAAILNCSLNLMNHQYNCIVDEKGNFNI